MLVITGIQATMCYFQGSYNMKYMFFDVDWSSPRRGYHIAVEQNWP
jgi:hypothetical protein